MANIKIKTKGMHCSSCEILVKDSLEELDGVNTANADHKSGVISIDFDDSKVNEKDSIEVIKQEGYEIK